MKNVIFSIFILSFLTLQSCVPQAPCNGCGDGNSGNGYNSSQLYVGDIITAQVITYPHLSYSISLDGDFDGGFDYTGVAQSGYILNDIQYAWNSSTSFPMITGRVSDVLPKIDIDILGVLSGSNKMDEGSEFELDGETYTVCFVTQDFKGVPLIKHDQKGNVVKGEVMIKVLRLKSKISELQDMDDE